MLTQPILLVEDDDGASNHAHRQANLVKAAGISCWFLKIGIFMGIFCVIA